MTDRAKLIKLYEKAFKEWMNNTNGNPTVSEFICDYLLANGIIVPPCNVGDKVYLPCLTDWGDIENYTITEFVLNNDGLCFVVDDEDRETHSIEIIGKEVFLTKEEAEANLDKRGKEND